MSKEFIIEKLLRDNIFLATGCTEPVAVALCVAKAKEVLGVQPEKIELFISQNVIKNAMGVGIPGTGMIGLPIAISLGVVCGDSSKGLEVLSCSKEYLPIAKDWMDTHKIEIHHAKDVDKLYIECIAFAGNQSSKVIIAQTHQNFVYIQKNDDIILDTPILNVKQESVSNNILIDSKDIFDYATKTEISKLNWILEIVEVISQASEEGLSGDYGLQIGKILMSDEETSLRKRVIAKTCAASDARMGGATTAVYSNSGSGNQGITCTLPIYEFAKETNKSEDEIIRALMLSHLISIYIKQYIGRLSALCGLINASIGVSSGLVYLQGGNFDQVSYAIKNMINTTTGMICDGAKPSCSLKMSVALNSAFDSSTLAIRNIGVEPTDGISEKSLERSIQNIGKIGRYGMDSIDDLILEILTSKED
ncbi:MAG: L-serine ammonia-lyase, iron-sulfur-dependent, subunit alpha [Bacteroidales bacterium]|nr:L-serine ammonia-lyase, iron-sulfur-dependent, subunit alpha [Bacteroidales bacterium]